MKRARKTSTVKWAIGGLAVIAFLVFAGPLVFGSEGLVRYFELRKELAKTEARIALVRQQNAELKRQLEALQKQSPLALEEEARRHHLIGPCEELYEVKVK
jgi:cell division protein FtsB